jgi:hypothetical protein
VTEPGEHAACVTKAATTWSFKKADAESKVKLLFGPQ